MQTLLNFLATFPLLSYACSIRPCLNGGSFNISLCQCICLSTFTGNIIFCIIVKFIKLISFLQGQFCEKINTEGTITTIFVSTSTHSSGSCTIIPCINGGSFDVVTCKCFCLSAFSGTN